MYVHIINFKEGCESYHSLQASNVCSDTCTGYSTVHTEVMLYNELLSFSSYTDRIYT